MAKPNPLSSLRLLALTALTLNLYGSNTQAQSDAALLWLAAGARNTPCDDVDQCAIDAGLACLGNTCVDAGQVSEACRPSGHPLGKGCDQGLACDQQECAPAGARDQVCRPCIDASTIFGCDRCDFGLGCDTTSFTCEPAGARNQPCRDDRANIITGQSIPACDGQLECTMGKCLDTGEESQPCSAGKTCGAGLFCRESSSGGGTCVAMPHGLVSESDTKFATSCVWDVPVLFRQLANWGESYANTFSFDAREGERLPPENARVAGYNTDVFQDGLWDPNIDHVQGIIELQDGRFLHTRANDDADPAGLVISDRSKSRFFYPMSREPIRSKHPGGLSSFGNTIAVAVEHGEVEREYCFEEVLGEEVTCSGSYIDDDMGWVDFWEYDPANQDNPLRTAGQLDTMQLDGDGRSPSSVAMTRTPDGKKLLFLLGQRSREGWLLLENGWGSFTQLAYFEDLYKLHEYGPVWPGGWRTTHWRMVQNIHFVTQCDGSLYLVASAGNDEIKPSERENHVDLYKLVAGKRGAFSLEHVDYFQPMYDHTRCEARYAANPVVKNHRLQFICATGTTSISGSDNIGVAELTPRSYIPDPTGKPPGVVCCAADPETAECLDWPPDNGACP